MNTAIQVKFPHIPGNAYYREGAWQTPGLRDAGSFARRLNADYNAGYLTPYANALAAVEALGGEILSPDHDPYEDGPDDDAALPPIY